MFRKYGQQLGLVGLGWSSQEHRVQLGVDGWLLIVVIGEGKLVVPMDFAVRRPDPTGPGGPCRDKLTWLQVMLDWTWTALQRRVSAAAAAPGDADSRFGDSGLMAHVAAANGGSW